MPTRTKKERARAAMRAIAACALAAALALPGAAFADTSLGIRVYDGAQTPGSGDGTTALGIKVTSPTYTITWDANGGTWPDGSDADKVTTVDYGQATTAPEDTPTRTGYTFAGWSDSLSGSAQTLPGSTISASTWYAVWNINTYSIAYTIANGANATTNPVTYQTTDLPLTIDAATPSEGYAFNGWTCAQLGINEATANLQIPVNTTGNLTVAADISAVSYTVAFSTNGGSGGPAAVTATYGQDMPAINTLPKRTGYAFMGYYDAAGGGTMYYTAKGESARIWDKTENVTLHAHWSLILSAMAPVKAVVHIENGEVIPDTGQAIESHTAAPLQAASVTCTFDDRDTASVFPNAIERAQVELTLAANGGTPVNIGLGETLSESQLADFMMLSGTEENPERIELSFGLSYPDNAQIEYTGIEQPFASIVWTVRPADFYLEDKNTHQIYSLAEVKTHAEDISANGEASPYYEQYKAYVFDDTTYACQTVWGNVPYDVRVIGINHDDLVTTAGGRTKAGLTFQFKNLLEGNECQMNLTNTNEGGWGSTELRKNMNSGDIWNTVPSKLQDAIVPVKKYYGADSKSTADIVSASNDSLFIASYYEHTGSVFDAWSSYQWLAKEGNQYEFYKNKSINDNGSDRTLVKGLQSSPDVAMRWWERSAGPSSAVRFIYVGLNGDPSVNYNADYAHSVCPCFCL